MRQPRLTPAKQYRWILPVLTMLLLLAVAACSAGGSDAGASASNAEPDPGSSATAMFGFAEEPPPDWSGVVIGVGALPPEAHQTLALIATDGPYPYRQDGSTFQNREGILPDRRAGFYREFTVDTPGSPDRGARRLVVGDDSAAYYTADHYDSFTFVEP